MSNMSYCRFRNTVNDLRDCADSIDEEVESIEEHKARLKLVEIAREIVDAADNEYIPDYVEESDDDED